MPGVGTSGPLLVTGIALIGVILPLASLASRLLSDREACFQHTALLSQKLVLEQTPQLKIPIRQYFLD